MTVKVDIAMTVPEGKKYYDRSFGDDGDYVACTGFETPTLMNVLTDKRAEESQVIETLKRRGCIINEVYAEDNFELGSTVWVAKAGGRLDTEYKNNVIDAARESLAWQVPERAKQIDVSGTLTDTELNIVIVFTRKDGVTDKQYLTIWNNTGA